MFIRGMSAAGSVERGLWGGRRQDCRTWKSQAESAVLATENELEGYDGWLVIRIGEMREKKTTFCPLEGLVSILLFSNLADLSGTPHFVA